MPIPAGWRSVHGTTTKEESTATTPHLAGTTTVYRLEQAHPGLRISDIRLANLNRRPPRYLITGLGTIGQSRVVILGEARWDRRQAAWDLTEIRVESIDDLPGQDDREEGLRR